MTNTAAGGKTADKRKRRWGLKKGAGGVKKRGDNWNNVTPSSKKWLKFYPQCPHYCTHSDKRLHTSLPVIIQQQFQGNLCLMNDVPSS